MKAQSKKILAVICMLLFCLAGYSGYRAYEAILGYRQARQAYREYSQEYVVYNNGSGSPEAVVEEEPAAPSETSPLSVDFHDLRKNLNPEICAWIWCPDTVINYPVVQHSENGYYLNVNVNGEQNASGAIFLDSANFSDFRDTNPGYQQYTPRASYGRRFHVCVPGQMAAGGLSGRASSHVSEHAFM